jgi:protein transport protein YIF1
MNDGVQGAAVEFLPPREDVNSPGMYTWALPMMTLVASLKVRFTFTNRGSETDMYIPVMAFITYILLSTLLAGLNGKFEPQLLGLTFSNSLVIIVLELIVLWLGRYFLNINSESQIYDLIAYSGYKFVGVIVTIAVAAVFNAGKGTGGWAGWGVFAYTFLANAFFLVSEHRCQLQKLLAIAV